MTAPLDIVAAMNNPQLFQPSFAGASWNGWRTVLKAAYALKMSGAEREFFRSIAHRDPPTKRVKELWIVVGRRGGKDFDQLTDHGLHRGDVHRPRSLAARREAALSGTGM